MTTNQDNDLAQSHNIWAYLVIAMLSVNLYTLEKTWKIFDQLKANGLFDPHNFAIWSHEELLQKLIASNYNRGAMIGIFVERLITISNLVDDIKSNELILATGTRQEVAKLLTRIKGVGPVVLDNFFILREN